MGITKKFLKRSVVFAICAALFLSVIIPKEVFALTKVPTNSVRVSGETRYDTAFEVADTLAKRYGSFSSIIVTSGEAYPDALSGSYLAFEEDAPVLLINPEKENDVYNYIRTHIRSNGTVYLLGGEYAVSGRFEERLTESNIKTQRLAGKDRYDTNLAILNGNIPYGEKLIICSGKGFADNLSASATGLPILLVDGVLTSEQMSFIREMRPSQIYVVGGTSAVNTAVMVQAGWYSDVERLGGATRYETSVLLAEEFFRDDQETVVFTNGMNFPDGLSGAPLAMYLQSPIILVNNNTNMDVAHNYIENVEAYTSYILGGASAVSQNTVDSIMERYREVHSSASPQNTGTAYDLVNVMRSWLGFSEIKGDFKQIIDLYNSILPLPVNYIVRYTDEWCDTCVSAAAFKAGCADLIGRECGVGRHLDIFRRKGIWIEDGTVVPEPGYIIIYNWNKFGQPNNWGASHIGVVESVIITGEDEAGRPVGTVIAIEGNYQERVARRQFPIGWGYIRGYAAPNYPETTD